MEESLTEALGLEETYTLVYENEETEIYAHTLYYEVPKFDYDKFVTEDETPVDNLFSETQQRVYIDPLYASQWTDRDFMACSNVAIYYKPKASPVVPDMFLSFDVTKPKEWHDKKNKCYFLWRMKKAPELVIEIVSNKEGNENTTKFDIYASIGVLYYIIHDPYKELYQQELNVFQLVNGKYEPYQAEEHCYMPEITLGLRLWEGIFENASAPYIRWCDKAGTVLRTGAEGIAEEEKRAKEAEERAEQARLLAEQESQRAEQEAQRAEQESQRAEQESQRAKEADAKAKREAKKAEKAEAKAKAEAQRALEAEAKVQELLKRLKEMGLEPAQ
ncbi:MAG: Uma2 family endonuclease [Bacteroidetes bacterium]|nr:MAG: Uma2 family endonuclease [Bacteroidota bacterium]